jgi:hypothetical protein
MVSLTQLLFFFCATQAKRKRKVKLTPEEDAVLIEEQERLLEQSKKSMQGELC